MSIFDSILVPLDGSETSAKSLGPALWLAQRLGAALHILSAGRPELSARDELRRLHVPQAHWADVRLHQAATFPEQAVLDAVERCAAQLLVMTARGEAADEARAEAGDEDPLKLPGHVTHWMIENSPVPVLVLPPCFREHLPWTTSLVPISGEPEADGALTVAVQLADALGLKVTVAHVLDSDGEAGLAAQSRYADAPHHEYPDRLEELVERALPEKRRGEVHCIADVVLARGEIADELLRLIESQATGLLVLGWRGRFLAGHARVVRTLLQRISCPVLLVKAERRAPFRLKVGEELE